MSNYRKIRQVSCAFINYWLLELATSRYTKIFLDSLSNCSDFFKFANVVSRKNPKLECDVILNIYDILMRLSPSAANCMSSLVTSSAYRDFISQHSKNYCFRRGFTINEETADTSFLVIVSRYLACVQTTEIERCNVAKVRDFVIIIDGGIINAVIAARNVYTII